MIAAMQRLDIRWPQIQLRSHTVFIYLKSLVVYLHLKQHDYHLVAAPDISPLKEDTHACFYVFMAADFCLDAQ